MTRATTTRLLAIVAAICFLLGNLSVWAHEVVYDRIGFRETARAIFDEPDVQQHIAEQAVTALAGEGEDRKPLPKVLERRLTNELGQALGSPALTPFVNAMLDFTWRVVVDREPEPVVLELTALRAIGLAIAEEQDPELAGRIRELPKPLRVTVLEADDVPSLAPYRGPVQGFVWIVCILALLGGFLSIYLAEDVPQAMRRLGLWVGIPAGIVALLALIAPSIVGGDQPLVHIATRVLMTRLFLQCLTLAAFSFGLYWLGKAGGWLRNIDQQLQRIEAKLDARAS